MTEASESATSTVGQERGSVAGERGIASVNQVRSLQSRLTAWFAIGLLSLLTAAFLAWYYRGLMARQLAPRGEAVKSLNRRSAGEMTLPPLGRSAIPVVDPAPDSALATLLGARPEPPTGMRPTAKRTSGTGGTSSSRGTSPLDRQLKGAVFAPLSGSSQPSAASNLSNLAVAGTELPKQRAQSSSEGGELGQLLTAHSTPSVAARLLPIQRLLLPKGAFLDCTLETAIDSSLPGMTTCITATDTYGADGSVVLLERGSKLVGETRGDVRAAGRRLFVLWTEARTPTGVVIPLASPGTDELGRSGLPGYVERHFWARFGAAMLVSIVDGAVQAAGRSSGNSLVISPNGPKDLATEILRDTIRIPPTLHKAQGDRMQVLVARDLDFRDVYRLVTQEN
jgi:type IV secretion system protein VirB10